MSYTVDILPHARRDLKNLPAHLYGRVIHLINELGNDPYPPRSKQLEEPLEHLRRMPLEKWRIIYAVDEAEQLITVVRVKLKTGPETYEDLEP